MNLRRVRHEALSGMEGNMEWYQPLVLQISPHFYDGKFGRKMKISQRPCSRAFFSDFFFRFFEANSIRNHK